MFIFLFQNRLKLGMALIILSLIFSTCSQDPVSSGQRGVSIIQLKIELAERNEDQSLLEPLRKPLIITKVTVTVSASDMTTITKELEEDDDKLYSGSIEVPKGNGRQFTVKAIDANNTTQYEGSTTVDIQNDPQQVAITLTPLYPNPVALTISDYSASSVTLSWTRNNDNDFSFYRVMRSETSTFDLNNKDDRVIDLTSRSQTTYTDSDLLPETLYYYCVWVVDTERLGHRSNIESVTTEAESGQTFTLSYDDGTFEKYLHSTYTGDGLFVQFTAPTYPCFIKSAYYYLRDDSGEEGNYTIVILDSDNFPIFQSVALATKPTGWVGWDPNWGSDLDNGVVYDDFSVGMFYTTSNGWPWVGNDTTLVQYRSYYYEFSTDLFHLQYKGNLGIQVTVELLDGRLYKLTPQGQQQLVNSSLLTVLPTNPCPGVASPRKNPFGQFIQNCPPLATPRLRAEPVE